LLSPDEEAQFWVLYRKTSAVLFRKAYRMCLGNQADADDALQRTYLKALEHWSTVSERPDQVRYGWLATTLTREVLQIWRAPHRAREAGSYDDAVQRPDVSIRAGDAEAIDTKDRYQGVLRTIARLEGRQQEVVGLHCLGGYEISEVAKMLGISSPTVRVHLHHGRRRLLEIMAEEEEPA
jgi:RNA polymerase sigma factor (sigma-70 family)